ncbi:gephyrin-like molybdotransferase Glp [Amaricoccus sp.]|uniref:molybdopterin molybdotransferase MoeA n=1 Tax=Amaricoccus sp. TaxID=1872485 RepID=UPI001B54D29F|nr:gephyrin-like molybdotransferase Glp [Amaricoccus sp.]MBP7241035.1 molybdopterin molybdotransferase MoeA [Amaricoccus sp.]
MLSVADAHARILALVAPLGEEEIPLAEAGGRVLARPVAASRDQPPFAASAMDGYAVRDADAVPGARLRVIGAAQAGAAFSGVVGPGEAARIFTGAPMPPGADAVVIQEDAEREGDTILVRPGRDGARHVRPAAADFAAGTTISAPRRLRPADVALLAAMNAARVPVARRPVVAIIPTGDEIVAPGGVPGPDQIVASNNYGLKAMVEAAGGEARLLPIARDTPESLAAVLALTGDADLVVTLGGASVGDFDIVQKTAIAHGLALDFHKVAIRPGKPLMAGRLGARAMIGLPGNPVSALVCGQLFVLPAVERMLGLPGDLPTALPARLAEAVGPNGPRTHYMRARVEAGPAGWSCTPFVRQDSALLSVLAAANALLVRPPDAPSQPAGDKVEFIWAA